MWNEWARKCLLSTVLLLSNMASSMARLRLPPTDLEQEMVNRLGLVNVYF